MHRNIINYFITFILISCQLAQKKQNNYAKRDIAALSKVGELFIKELAKQTKIPHEQIERDLIKHILKGKNYEQAGLSLKEAKSLKSFSDDLPFSPKAMDWGIHNIQDVFPRIKDQTLKAIYKDTYQKYYGGKNIFSKNVLLKRRGHLAVQLHFKKELRTILSKIDKFDAPPVFSSLKESTVIIEQRAKNDIEFLANGKLIIESAYKISSKTGISSMGQGCIAFLKTAPKEVYAMKANIDHFRAQIIENMANQKNMNKAVESYIKIPENLRLTQNEIDEGTILAFKKVLGQSEVEARTTLNLLKDVPCQLY